MAIIRRQFGIVDDAVAGGSQYDTAAGVIPDPTTFYPVTGGTLDWNLERIDRNDEVRGRRAASAPLPFRAAPVITVPVPAYRSVVEKLLRKTLGGVDAVTGTAPAAITHTLPALGFGATALPAINVGIVRDDLYQKMAGGQVNRLALSFPLDGEGTVEAEIHGLYAANFGTAPPTATFTGLSTDVLMLRDAQMFIDGNVTAIPDLQGFEFTWVNNLAPKWYAKKNVVPQVIGTPSLTRKLWFPSERKLGSAQDVTFAMNFGNVNVAQELALQYGQIEKLVFEVSGAPLGTTPAATELLRITIFNAMFTGGGAEALSARDDITARFEGGAFYSDADSADVKIEVVNATATLLT